MALEAAGGDKHRERSRVSRVLRGRAPRRRIFRRSSAPVATTESLRTLPVVLPVTAAGTAILCIAAVALLVDRPSLAVVAGALGLLAASTIAEAFPTPLEGVRGATSLATVFIVAAAVLYGWPIAAVVAFLTMIVVELAWRRPLLRLAYNTALYVCAAAAAGAVAALVADDGLGALVSQTLLASAVFYSVDIGLLAAVIARARTQPFVATAREYVSSTAVPALILASLTATLVLLWDRSPFVTVVLIGPLLAIAFYQRWLHGALARLREFDRLKDEFIAVTSHELRTPLTSVYGAAMTLREQQQLDDETRRSLLTIVTTESQRLARLLDDVLWASRLDTGRDETRIQPSDATAIVEAVVDAARSRLPPSLSLELYVEPELPPVAADPDRLRQVLVNLVDNAVKYSPDGGRITVDVERSGREVRFSVRDEGIGIPEHEQERVFEKFHRLDPHMTRGVGGTGLGLYICRELVQRMGGRIWMEPRDGGGSTFVFTLPVART